MQECEGQTPGFESRGRGLAETFMVGLGCSHLTLPETSPECVPSGPEQTGGSHCREDGLGFDFRSRSLSGGPDHSAVAIPVT